MAGHGIDNEVQGTSHRCLNLILVKKSCFVKMLILTFLMLMLMQHLNKRKDNHEINKINGTKIGLAAQICGLPH